MKKLWRAVLAGDALQVTRLLLPPHAGDAAQDAHISVCTAGAVHTPSHETKLSCSPGHLLHLAVERSDAAIVTLLLEHGAVSIDAPLQAPTKAFESRRGYSPLMLAASQSDVRVMRILLTHGARVNYSHRWTPLMVAVLSGSADAVKILLEHGADTERTRGHYRDRALSFAIRCNEDIEILRVLLEHGVQIDALQHMRKTALFLAASIPKLEAVDLLIARGADVNARDDEGRMAIHGAADHDFDHVVKVLIAEGADVDAADRTGKTALHRAALCSGTCTVATLLAHGASALIQDEHGLTPLCYATRYGKIDAVRVLLDAHGVCEDFISSSLERLACVLDEAVTQDREEIVSLVLKKIREIASSGCKSLNPVYRRSLFKAVRGHKWPIAELLARASTSLDTRDANGKTLLSQAVESGDMRRVQMLLECDASADSPESETRTPLHIASDKGIVEIVDSSRKNGAGGLHDRRRSGE